MPLINIYLLGNFGSPLISRDMIPVKSAPVKSAPVKSARYKITFGPII